MGKRNFRPLEQTLRDKPGEKFKIMQRVSGVAAHPKRDETLTKGWETIPNATGLNRRIAEILMERFQNGPHGAMFEHAIIPMHQEIP